MASERLILLPTDGSATAEAAARFAEDIALAERSPILVLGIAEPAIVMGIDQKTVTEPLVEATRDTVAGEAARLRQAGVECEELVIVAATPHVGILKVAEERGATLIVMGTHGRSALARAILGSVADRVVRHSNIPVVLVPRETDSQ
ncbi:MAG: universal stress protein [Anaerosomatales bacterium]|nr:universal stress protein [Anaerosomatales bacterium]MDT8435008.1 universal stress protein [Anaerosomatales bacterium]